VAAHWSTSIQIPVPFISIIEGFSTSIRYPPTTLEDLGTGFRAPTWSPLVGSWFEWTGRIEHKIVAELNAFFENVSASPSDSCAGNRMLPPDCIRKNAQGLIEEAIPIEECQGFIRILWARFGTPTSSCESGTIHEFQRAYENLRREHHVSTGGYLGWFCCARSGSDGGLIFCFRSAIFSVAH
jgi:hypothetical protein